MCSDVCIAFEKDKYIGEVLKGCSILWGAATSKPDIVAALLHHQVQKLCLLERITFHICSFLDQYRLQAAYFQVVFCLFATFRIYSASVWESIPPLLPGNKPSALGKPTVSEHFPLHVSIFHSLCTRWYGTGIVYFGYVAVKNGTLCICADRTSRDLSSQVNIKNLSSFFFFFFPGKTVGCS